MIWLAAALLILLLLLRRQLAIHRGAAHKLAHMLAERIEAEEQAVAQAWCCGWQDRGAFDACVSEERGAAVRRYAKGLAN